MRSSVRFVLAVAAAAALVQPSAAQRQSLGYQFLEGIKKRDGAAVNKVVSQPGIGSAVVDYQADGEAAIHVVTRACDETYLKFVLAHGADPNLRNGAGNPPMVVAVDENQPRCVEILSKNGGKVDFANRSGETALIRAVQLHNLPMVQLLLSLSANPDQPDIIAGKSARDYATGDTRYPAIAKLLRDAPKQSARRAAGPTLR